MLGLPRKARAAVIEHGQAAPAKAMAPRVAMKTSRAVITLVAGLVVRAVVALPMLSMHLGLPDGSSEPTSSTQYKAYTLTTEAVGAGSNGPLVVVAALPER